MDGVSSLIQRAAVWSNAHTWFLRLAFPLVLRETLCPSRAFFFSNLKWVFLLRCQEPYLTTASLTQNHKCVSTGFNLIEREVAVKYLLFGKREFVWPCRGMGGGYIPGNPASINTNYSTHSKKPSILLLIPKHLIPKLKGLRYYLCSWKQK